MTTKAASFFTCLIASVSLLGGLIFGFDIGGMTGSVLFIKQEFGLGNSEIGLVVGSSLLGCAIGALVSAPLSTFLGRRTLVFISTLLYFLSAFSLFFTDGLQFLYVFRLLIGFGIGIASFAIPIYIAELAPKEHRGALVSMYQLAITLGILIAFGMGYLNAEKMEWRPIFLFNAAFSSLFLVMIPFLPRSPRYLYMKGHKEEAIRILRKIRPASKVDSELEEIKKNDSQESGVNNPLWKYKAPLLIGIGVSIFQQLTGINAVIFYAPTILQKTGIQDHGMLLLLTAAIGVVNSISTVVCMLIIDKVGRRPLLFVGIGGMFIGLMILFTTFHFISTDETVLTLIGLMLFIAFFAVGLGPLFWVISSEIFPLAVRGIGMSLATLVNWISNFIVSSTFLILTDAVSFSGAFLIYALISVLAFFFIYRYVPETKGMSLEKIEELWSR